MARELDLTKPLSQEDIDWLNSRYHQSYVARVIELAGGQAEDAGDASEQPSGSDQAPSAPEGENGPENGGDGGEDLIGSTTTDFDPGQHTADEVLAHLKDASDEEKARVLELEKDGKGRVTILNA